MNIKRLDDPSIPVATTTVGLILYGMQGGLTVKVVPTLFEGTDGADGINGKSAYQVAVDNGFVGTQAQWLDSLIGNSAYEDWLANGGEGTFQDFLDEIVEPVRAELDEKATSAELSQLADEVSQKANKIQEEWIVPTLSNGWIQDDAADSMNIGYMKDDMGFVHLRGRIKNGTLGEPAFTLPLGYRPVNDLRFPVVSNNSFGYIWIRKGGDCYLYGSNEFIDLGEITFRV